MKVGSLLQIVNLRVSYGAIEAVRGVSLSVDAGEIVAVLGANGAGKTSTLRAISGLMRRASGSIMWNGEDVSTWPAHRLVRAGLVMVPEGRRIFAPLSVGENLQLGAHSNRSAADRKALEAEIFEMFPVLADRRRVQAGLLSGGEQQMLAFGRALMSKPQMILMDEPSVGLAPTVVDNIMNTATAISRRGIGILLVEQNAVAALSIAARGVVLERGTCILEGTAAELRSDPGVVRAFLGKRADPSSEH